MLKGTWKSFYSLFGPSTSPPLFQSLSSWLGASSTLSSSASSASASPPPAQSSSSLPSSSSSASSSATASSSSLNLSSGGGGALAAVTLYKAIAFLALLSLIPSGPSSSTSSIIVSASMTKEADMQKIFKLRNENEWKSLWHSEKHVRCRDQLLMHMDWACQKDIYRLEKRFQRVPMGGRDIDREPMASPSDNGPLVGDVFIGKALADTVIKPWSGYLRRKREEKSITDECCSAAGCSWEEYAEYCPAHRRVQAKRIVTRK